MGEPRVLEATATREGKWWNIAIPELDQVTATKKSSEVQEYANSLAAAVLDVPEADVDVQVVYTLPEAVEADWKAAREETRKAKELTIAAAGHTKTVVLTLREDGYSGRDIAKMLGLTFQRVSQILNS